MNVRQARHPRQVTKVPAATAPPSLRSEQLADAPLVQLLLDEATGTTATDSSGNGRDGTYSGTYTLQAAAIGSNGAASTAFAGGIVTVPDAAWMDVDSWTIEALIYSTSTVYYRAWAMRDNGTERLWIGMIEGGKPGDLGWNNSGGIFYNAAHAGSAFSLNTAYHVTTRWDSASHKFEAFTNGVLQFAATTTGTAQTGARPLTVAGGSTGLAFAGRISHVAYYGVALSNARILAHAQVAGLA
ncbi:MAG TPA: hypothetical protein PKW63_14535 [Vicinamibacterales bacterium]|nr:hypothetical protein [Vicinamibacterales bacterium]